MGPENEQGAGNELRKRRAEQFPHLGNYTLTPGFTGEAGDIEQSLRPCIRRRSSCAYLEIEMQSENVKNGYKFGSTDAAGELQNTLKSLNCS